MFNVDKSVSGVLKICSKFTAEHACQSVISLKPLCNFIEIALWHSYSPVNLPHIFRTVFLPEHIKRDDFVSLMFP